LERTRVPRGFVDPGGYTNERVPVGATEFMVRLLAVRRPGTEAVAVAVAVAVRVAAVTELVTREPT